MQHIPSEIILVPRSYKSGVQNSWHSVSRSFPRHPLIFGENHGLRKLFAINRFRLPSSVLTCFHQLFIPALVILHWHTQSAFQVPQGLWSLDVEIGVWLEVKSLFFHLKTPKNNQNVVPTPKTQHLFLGEV